MFYIKNWLSLEVVTIIKVCDAIMGTGKSQSAIAYMNEHSDDKFIYITPYLDEANRIKKGCPSLHFIEPSNKLEKYKFKKHLHTAALISEGRNITTTHQAFKNYTPAVLENIKQQGYTLIIDENVDVLQVCDFHPGDIQLALDAGYITDNDGLYTFTGKEYSGKAFTELFSFMKSRELMRVEDGGANLFYWTLPPDLLTSFKDVIILTYLFDGQSLHHFMKIYDIPYEYIGIERADNETGFRFCEPPGYIPEYVSHLGDMINIIDNTRINSIGDEYYALSKNWYEKDKGNADKLKKNVDNFYNNIWRDIPADRRLWGTYNGAFSKIKGKGYTRAFLTFNAKATNAYKDRDCLVYLANIFMNVNEKKFYQKHGIEVDEDIYALSIMVQWIWRSAIRDGNKVNLYIPSKRMRTILINWIENASKGGNKVEL